jgi:hypothetical protein
VIAIAGLAKVFIGEVIEAGECLIVTWTFGQSNIHNIFYLNNKVLEISNLYLAANDILRFFS